MADKSKLIIDVRMGETISLPGDVSLQILEKSGRIARLAFFAPKDALIKKVDKHVPSMAQYLPVK